VPGVLATEVLGKLVIDVPGELAFDGILVDVAMQEQFSKQNMVKNTKLTEQLNYIEV